MFFFSFLSINPQIPLGDSPVTFEKRQSNKRNEQSHTHVINDLGERTNQLRGLPWYMLSNLMGKERKILGRVARERVCIANDSYVK